MVVSIYSLVVTVFVSNVFNVTHGVLAMSHIEYIANKNAMVLEMLSAKNKTNNK